MKKSPNTVRKWKPRESHQNVDYTTIVDRLRTVSWGNKCHPSSVVKPVYGIPTFPLTAKASHVMIRCTQALRNMGNKCINLFKNVICTYLCKYANMYKNAYCLHVKIMCINNWNKTYAEVDSTKLFDTFSYQYKCTKADLIFLSNGTCYQCQCHLSPCNCFKPCTLSWLNYYI